MKLRLSKTMAVAASGAAMALAIPVVGLSSSSGASAKPTYTVGVEGPFSGQLADLGKWILGGAQLAVNQANASGKDPFKLKVMKFDDQCSSQLGPAEAQKAVGTMGLVAVVGPTCSGPSETAAKYYKGASLAEVSASATAVALATGKKSNFFRVVADDNVQGSADAKYLVKTLGVKNLLVIGDASFYGDGLASVVAKTAKKLGATVTTRTIPNTASGGGGSPTEYSGDATAIATENPGGIFYGGYHADFGLLLGALYQAGYTASSKVIMSGDGSNSTALISQNTSPASAADGVYLSQSAAGKVNYFSGKLAKAYQKLTGLKASSALYAAQAYDAATAVIKALVKAKLPAKMNKTTLRSLRHAVVTNLHKIAFKGVTGPIAFQGNGNLRADRGAVSISKVVSGQITSVTTVKD